MLKILHVINALEMGGAERLLVELAPLMRDGDHQVEIAVSDAIQTNLYNELIKKEFRIHCLGKAGSKYNPLILTRLIKLLRKEKYDIVHSHLFPSQYWVVIAKWLSNCKNTRLVTTEHSTNNSRARFKITSWIDSLFYNKYDHIICISPAVENFILSRISSKNKCSVIENGVNITEFKQATCINLEESLEPNIFKLIQVARFQEAKDQDCLIRALTLLPEDIHAFFIGDGERREECAALARNLCVEKRTHFLGIRTDIPNLLIASDIGIMSSHWEGFGLSAVEAMAAGLPVLASDVPGLAEVVQDKELLFTPGDEKELANKITRLHKSKDYYAEKAKRCSKRALDFDIKHTCKKHLSLYHELCRQK